MAPDVLDGRDETIRLDVRPRDSWTECGRQLSRTGLTQLECLLAIVLCATDGAQPLAR
jgi:hypothetical protein